MDDGSDEDVDFDAVLQPVEGCVDPYPQLGGGEADPGGGDGGVRPAVPKRGRQALEAGATVYGKPSERTKQQHIALTDLMRVARAKKKLSERERERERDGRRGVERHGRACSEHTPLDLGRKGRKHLEARWNEQRAIAKSGADASST